MNTPVGYTQTALVDPFEVEATAVKLSTYL